MLRRPGSDPTVVFIESGSWQAFLDLAGALRTAGVGITRVTIRSATRRTRLVSLVESGVFDRTLRLVEGGRASGTAPDLNGPEVAAALDLERVDIQAQDDLVPALLRDELVPAYRRLAEGVDPAVVADKAVQAAWASTAGVATPDSWSSPDDVPLPAIVKAPVGSGGQGVRVVTTPDELELAWIDLTDAAGRPPFAQRLLRKSVSTGGVALDGRVLVGTAYDGHPAADDPTGPPAVVVAVDDEEVMDLTRRVLAEIGYTGLFCIDWVRDEDGAAYLIDLNARVFGSWVALQALGLDLLGAYLHTLGIAPEPQPTRATLGRAEPTLRYPCPTTSTPSAVRSWRRESLAIVRRRRGWLGDRWALAVWVRTEIGTVSALARVARRRQVTRPAASR